MSKQRDHIKALERRRHFLERKLKTNGVLYPSRNFDKVEYAALGEAIKLMEEKTWGARTGKKGH